MRKGLLLLVLAIIAGCETDRTIFHGPYFVRFTPTSMTKLESYTKPITIEVHQAGPPLEEDLTVTYQISGSAREGIDFVILSDPGKVVIKKGEYLANIDMQLINNSNNILRTQDAIFTIKALSTGERQIGQGESAIGNSFTFTINDDCVLGGTYIAHNGSSTIDNITITSTDCETYTVSNWNIDVFNDTTPMDLKFKDHGDNTLTIPKQKETNLPDTLQNIQGAGSVDPTTKNIILTIKLLDFDEQPEVTITYTPD